MKKLPAKTISPRCRIGLVQLATIPAYVTPKVEWLREPAPPLDEKTQPYLAGIKNKPGIQGLRDAIYETYGQDLFSKLRLILQAVASHHVDLLVFPEYSIPLSALKQLSRWARENSSTIIAGSHTVVITPTALKEYADCGLRAVQESPNDFARKALSPIFFADGRTDFRLKVTRSKWEPDLLLGEADQEPFTITLQGQEISVQLLICIDALRLGMVGRGAKLLAVCALSPQIEPFQTLFTQALINEVPGVIANSAVYGGSQFSLTGPSTASDFAELLKVGTSDEVLLIADVELGRQFQKRRSVDSEPSWKLVARKPLLYRAVSSHARLSDLLESARANTTLQVPLSVLNEFALDPHLPKAMRQQLEMFIGASQEGAITPAEGQLLLDAISIPEVILPFWNRCRQGLEESNRQIATLLPDYPDDGSLTDALQTVSYGMRHAKGRLLPLTVQPSPLREGSAQAPHLFVNREDEVGRLSRRLLKDPVTLVTGLAGIGKKTLVQKVIDELFPRYHKKAIHCVDGMTPSELLEALAAALLAPERLKKLDAASKVRECHILVVHDLDLVDFRGSGLVDLVQYWELLHGTAIRIVFLASRNISELDIASLSLGPLNDDDTRRIFDYYCRLFGVSAIGQSDIVAHLWGYPLAARTAATLLREGGGETFAKLRFLKKLRSEVAKILFRGLSLSGEERKALEALSIFRRPVEAELVERLGIQDSIDGLESRFILSREDGRIFVIPLVREVAIEDWIKQGAATAYHRIAANHFKDQIASSDSIRRFEATDEAVYHFSSIGDFVTARSLGGDWFQRARSASRDLYRRRGYKESAAICEKALETTPTDRDFLVRLVMCSSKLRRWPRGKACIERLRSLGSVPAKALTSYGEALARAGIRQEGKAYLEECLEQHPGDPYALAVLANVHLDEGNLALARNLADEALEGDALCVRALEVASIISRSEGNNERAYELAYRLMGIDPQRGERIFQKARSALVKKYGGGVPGDLLKRLES